MCYDIANTDVLNTSHSSINNFTIFETAKTYSKLNDASYGWFAQRWTSFGFLVCIS